MSSANSTTAHVRSGLCWGNYFNPAWRVPTTTMRDAGLLQAFRHQKLEAFNQVNYNAYLHNSKALASKPQRFRHVQTDVYGHVARAAIQGYQSGRAGPERQPERQGTPAESLKAWGVLDKEYRYRASNAVSDSVATTSTRRRPDDAGKPSTPMGLHRAV